MVPAKRYALDAITVSPACAYSLRLLKKSYTGPLINVRRSSDNASRDIYYDALGNLDTADLLAFVGAGSGYVTTWYDQSESRNNATQGTAANQPQLVASGVPSLGLTFPSTTVIISQSSINALTVNFVSNPNQLQLSDPREASIIASAVPFPSDGSWEWPNVDGI